MISINQQLSKQLLHIFEGENWPDMTIKQAIEKISFVQANKVTIASPNSIAALVHHIGYWNDIVRQRSEGKYPEVPPENGMVIAPLKNDADWQKLIEQTRQSFIRLAEAIKNFPPEKMAEPSKHGGSTIEANFHGIIQHDYYHLGQIVILSHLV